MSNFLVSTFSFQSSPRTTVFRAQAELRIAQQEVVSGRFADVGLTLGSGTSRSISLRAEIDAADSQRSANQLVGQRLAVMQTALAAIAETGQSLQASLIATNSNPQLSAITSGEAKSAFSQLTSNLNVSSGARFLFSGTDSDRAALQFSNADGDRVDGYFDGSTAQDATATALDAFLITKGRTDTSELTPAELDEFLAGDFAALFDDRPPGDDTSDSWRNFSTVSGDPVTQLVDGGERLDMAYDADKAAFRDVAKAYVMLADLGSRSLSDETRQLLASRATETLGKGLSQVTDMRGAIGADQARIETLDQRLDARGAVLTGSIDQLEGVDQYEASTRITQLTNLLESSYALTARLSRLSLLNYL